MSEPEERSCPDGACWSRWRAPGRNRGFVVSLKIRCTDKNCGVCNPRVVPIPLPPEPPHDRVVEAVHQSGSVISRWAWDDEVESWSMFGYKGTAHWSQLVSGAIAVGFSLRHVAAESGEQT